MFDRILLGLPEYASPDEVKDDVPNVLAGMDSPVVEDGNHHGAEFLESVPPHTVEQLRPRYVAHADAFDFLLLLGGEIESVPQKEISVSLITWIAGNNGIESLGKANFLH